MSEVLALVRLGPGLERRDPIGVPLAHPERGPMVAGGPMRLETALGHQVPDDAGGLVGVPALAHEVRHRGRRRSDRPRIGVLGRVLDLLGAQGMGRQVGVGVREIIGRIHQAVPRAPRVRSALAVSLVLGRVLDDSPFLQGVVQPDHELMKIAHEGGDVGLELGRGEVGHELLEPVYDVFDERLHVVAGREVGDELRDLLREILELARHRRQQDDEGVFDLEPRAPGLPGEILHRPAGVVAALQVADVAAILAFDAARPVELRVLHPGQAAQPIHADEVRGAIGVEQRLGSVGLLVEVAAAPRDLHQQVGRVLVLPVVDAQASKPAAAARLRLGAGDRLQGRIDVDIFAVVDIQRALLRGADSVA